MGTTIELQARDGHRFAAYEARPAGAPRGAVVVVQEIFGVNGHIRAVADGYAADGYLAIAPALFDRAERGYDTGYSAAEIERGRAVMGALDWENTLGDVTAAVEHARVAGNVGIVGFCWGGTVAWRAAARVPGLSCAVSYYGGSVPAFAAEQPACPVLFHFGEKDTMPSPDQARAVAAAHPSAVAHFYPAGHGFNCDQRASFDADCARRARERTLAFFGRHLA